VDTRKIFWFLVVLVCGAYVAVAYAQVTSSQRNRPGVPAPAFRLTAMEKDDLTQHRLSL
jgi:hypothetical protein